jgi:hypothetical protein
MRALCLNDSFFVIKLASMIDAVVIDALEVVSLLTDLESGLHPGTLRCICGLARIHPAVLPKH